MASPADRLERALQDLGSELLPSTASEWDGYPMFVRIGDDGRRVDMHPSESEDWFVLEFWQQGACLARAETGSIEDAAISVQVWIDKKTNTAQLAYECSWVTALECAPHFEMGAEVDWAWNLLRQQLPGSAPDMVPFIEAAAGVPLLRGLFPHVQGNSLHFSRCTGQPYSQDCPSVIALGQLEFEVRSPDGRTLGVTDVPGALSTIVEALPADCGLAKAGHA